jgi:acyl-CoA thioesterase-1
MAIVLRRFWFFLVLATTLAACSARIPENTQNRILLLGDSMMAANSADSAGVAAALQQQLGEPVVDRSVSGARYLGLTQYSGLVYSQSIPQWKMAMGGAEWWRQ